MHNNFIFYFFFLLYYYHWFVVRNGLLGGLVAQDSAFHVMAASSDLSCVHGNNYPLMAVE